MSQPTDEEIGSAEAAYWNVFGELPIMTRPDDDAKWVRLLREAVDTGEPIPETLPEGTAS